MTKIRTLIVDDEPMARERVLSLLQQQPDIEVVGECADGAQALSAIERLEPELVFLDVQIPVMDGFGVIRALAPNRMPLVVFTTAYDEYALKAFEVHALDYLLKPFDSPRFLRTLERARDRLERQRAGDLGKRLLAHGPGPEARADAAARSARREVGRAHLLRAHRRDRLGRRRRQLRPAAREGRVVSVPRDDVGDGSRLDPSRFVRIHRSHIVNADRIKELQPGNGDHSVVLRSGQRLPLSRGYRDKLQERIANRS